MRIKIIITLAFIVLLSSCKDSNSKDKIDQQKEIDHSVFRKTNNNKSNQDLILRLNIISKKDDYIQLFYVEDYLESFTQEKSIIKKISGSEELQIVEFSIEDNLFPLMYRFDISDNKHQESILINSISISYRDNEIYIPNNRLLEYLIPNKGISYNSINKEFFLKSFTVQGKEIYDPYFTCSPELVRLILDL